MRSPYPNRFYFYFYFVWNSRSVAIGLQWNEINHSNYCTRFAIRNPSESDVTHHYVYGITYGVRIYNFILLPHNDDIEYCFADSMVCVGAAATNRICIKKHFSAFAPRYKFKLCGSSSLPLSHYIYVKCIAFYRWTWFFCYAFSLTLSINRVFFVSFQVSANPKLCLEFISMPLPHHRPYITIMKVK